MPFQEDASSLIQALARFDAESRAGDRPVVELTPMKELVETLELQRYVERGGLTGEAFQRFTQSYLEHCIRLAHPGSFAHQVAVPHPAGALGSLIGSFTNNSMAIYEMGPAAASIEFFVINWLLSKAGYAPSPYPSDPPPAQPFGAGVLTHGGSLANLTALIAARTRIAPTVWEDGVPSDLVLLAPPGCHYSITRAAGILGLGSKAVYPLEVARDGSILAERVEPLLATVAARGKRVLALVANACSTAVGRYDPLRPIAELCRERGIWLHVDGAHGASALLSPRHRQLLDGVELADSLTWDAHKLLETPGLCTAVLVREARSLDSAFHQQASYLFHDKRQPGVDFLHRTVECTKAGLGLRFYLVLAALGERGLASYLERQFALARSAHELLVRRGFETAVEPQSNIVCFRIPGSAEIELALRDRLLAEGSFHLSTAVFAERRYLRLVFSNPAASLTQVEQLIERISALAPGLA